MANTNVTKPCDKRVTNCDNGILVRKHSILVGKTPGRVEPGPCGASVIPFHPAAIAMEVQSGFC